MHKAPEIRVWQCNKKERHVIINRYNLYVNTWHAILDRWPKRSLDKCKPGSTNAKQCHFPAVGMLTWLQPPEHCCGQLLDGRNAGRIFVPHTSKKIRYLLRISGTIFYNCPDISGLGD